MQRPDNRAHNEVRPLKVTYNVFPYADGSVLFEMGNTKVLIAITLQSSIPPFLRGKKGGWLTAEYALLPASTQVRNIRESNLPNRQGRSIEIARFIGRVFRTVCNLEVLGERTVMIDCDVLQADGSTRAACVNGTLVALQIAQQKWLDDNIIHTPLLRELLFAVSVGISGNHVLLDLNYQEDVLVDADLTFVLTDTSNIIELQGTAERVPCSWKTYEQAYHCASQGIAHITNFLATTNAAYHSTYSIKNKKTSSAQSSTSF
jgi:ribonuclease PH